MATRTAASANSADVIKAIAGTGFSGPLQDGDVLIIPAGNVSWSETVNYSVAITIQGAGIGSLIIKDNIPATNTANNNSSLFNLTTQAGKSYRITGIEFQDGARTKELTKGIIAVRGVSNSIRIDHIKWANTHNRNLTIWDYARGVTDHCECTKQGSMHTFHSTWMGGTNGDGSWSNADSLGTADAWYIEDCDIGTEATASSGLMDGEGGARFVIRHCTIRGVQSSHGTEGGLDRSTRQFEIYENTFNNPWAAEANAIHIRGGSGVIWGNTVTGNYNNFATLNDYRAAQSYATWGMADGRNAWDHNQSGGPFETGSCTATPTVSGFVSMQDNTKTGGNAWSNNQWVGYSLVNLATGRGAVIQSNNSNTITSWPGASQDGLMTFSVGNNYQIWKVLAGLDMPGMGQGGSINRNSPAWPNQAIEGVWAWDNTFKGNPGLLVAPKYPYIVSGTHFHNNGSTAKPGYTPYTYPHPLISGSTIQSITSLNQVTFVAGTGGTFQVTVAGFSSTPTYSKSGSFPASGSTFSAGGLLTVGAGSAAGTYAFTITAINGSETASQSFTLLITAAPTRVISITGSLSFGDVDIATTSSKSITITNNGNANLNVSNITLPSGFTADWTSGVISPGANHSVVVTFAPIAGSSYSGTLTVVSDKTSGTNTLAVAGVGVTRVIGVSGSLAFGDITTGQTATRQLTINNTGNRTLSITAISYPTGFSGDLTSAAILAGASKIVNVTFAPTLVQNYSGNVDIISDKTSGTSASAASGAGVASASKIIQLTGSLAYGSVEDGTTVDKVLRLTNSGNTTLTVTDITFPSGFTPDWTAGTIAAGAHQDVTVTFAPVAAISYSGTVTVVSDATGGLNTTTASGTGTATSSKVISLATDTGGTFFNFGNVEVGSSTTRTLVITNSGTVVLTVSSITYPDGYSGAFSGTIDPGASQNVTVTLTPTAIQSYNGGITVNSDKTSGTNTFSTLGSGVSLATKIIAVSGNLAFGNIQKNHTAQRIMTISNSGTTTLTVSGITYPSGFSGAYSGTIPPGGSQDVTVTFAPTGQASYGGDITVASDKTSGVNTIACTGSGKNRKQVPMFIVIG